MIFHEIFIYYKSYIFTLASSSSLEDPEDDPEDDPEPEPEEPPDELELLPESDDFFFGNFSVVLVVVLVGVVAPVVVASFSLSRSDLATGG